MANLVHIEEYRPSLKDRTEQEKLLRHLKEQMGRQDKPEGFGFLLLLFRKLREGVTAQGIHDEFAVEVYECAARCALSAADHAEHHVCVVALARELYPNAVCRLSKVGADSKQLADLKRAHVCCVCSLVLHYACVVGGLDDSMPLLATQDDYIVKSTEVQAALNISRALDTANPHLFKRARTLLPASCEPLVVVGEGRLRTHVLARCAKAYLNMGLGDLAARLLLAGPGACRQYLEAGKTFGNSIDTEKDIVVFRKPK